MIVKLTSALKLASWFLAVCLTGWGRLGWPGTLDTVVELSLHNGEPFIGCACTLGLDPVNTLVPVYIGELEPVAGFWDSLTVEHFSTVRVIPAGSCLMVDGIGEGLGAGMPETFGPTVSPEFLFIPNELSLSRWLTHSQKAVYSFLEKIKVYSKNMVYV